MRFPFHTSCFSGIALAVLAALSQVSGGVSNPDISAIGQLRAGITDDPGSPDPEEPTLSLGESELVLTASLNPYLKGFFTLAADEEGLGVEEAYAQVQRGLPFGLGLKAGQYRLDLGKLNPVHPHAYPFIELPRAWASILPGGDEGFNEAAVQASLLLPTPGDWASTLYLDVIQGADFHPEEEETRLGWLGRWSNSLALGEMAAIELGLSGATGTDAVAEEQRGWLGGGDLKVKFYLPRSSQLVIQGEGILRRDHLGDTALGDAEEDRFGLYAFADYRHHGRWNVGALYDQVQRQGDPSALDRSVRVFAGFSLLEESTVLRAAWETFLPEGEDAVQSLALQFLFTMGPHKPHQF